MWVWEGYTVFFFISSAWDICKMPFAFYFNVKNSCYTFHFSLQYKIISPSLEVCSFVEFRDSFSIQMLPFALSELWHFPLTIDCSVSLKGTEPFWDWCDKTWQEIPLNKTNYTLEMCWTEWKQFGHQGQWKVLRRLRVMTFSFGLYLKYFDAQLSVNQFVSSLGCGPVGSLLQKVHIWMWASCIH